MEVARTLRNDREKMGEQPMYRPSRGHGQSQSQPQQAAVGPRARRNDDPLAELARLIGQEDPFKEFDSIQPRRAPSNGNGAQMAAQPQERRPANGSTQAYTNGARPVPARPIPQQEQQRLVSRAPQPQAAPIARPQTASPVARPAQAAVPARPAAQPRQEAYSGRQSVPAQPQARPVAPNRNPTDSSRVAARPVARDATSVDRSVRAEDPRARYADQDVPSARTQDPRARRAEPQQPVGRYVPEEAPRHARGRTQQPYQDAYQRGYENDYDPEYDDEAYLPDHADDVYDDVPRSGRGWGFWLVAGIIVASLIAVAFLGVFAYRAVFNTPPRAAVITKSNTPVKVEPQNQVPQTAVPQSNKPIQDRLGGNNEPTQVIRREENPVDLTRQPQPQMQQPAPQTQSAPQRAPQFTPPAQTQQPAPQNVEQQQPKRVKSVPLRSDGPAQATPQPQNNAPTPIGPNSAAPAPEQNTQAIPQNQNRPAVARNTTVASLGPTTPPQQATSGNYVVQVASHKTQEEAQQAWSGLRQQYAQIFNGKNADIRKVDLGDRGTFYRAMVGPMSRDQANALCQNLKTQGAGCIVQTR